MLITTTDKIAAHSAYLETMKQGITLVTKKGIDFAWRDSVAATVTEVSHCMTFVSIDLLCVTALHCYPTAISSQLWRTATPTNVIKITTPLPDHGHTVIVADVTRPVESPLIVNSSWHTIQPTTVFSSLASSVVSFSTVFSHPASSVASSSATFSSLASSVAPTSSVASPSTTFSSLASSVAPTSSMSSSSTTFRNPTGASLVMVPKSASFTYVTPSNIVFHPGGLAGFNTGIAWGVGIGVGGTAILMSMCLGLFCCVVCIRRRLKSFTLDKAGFDDSAHEGMPLGAILLLWMCTVNHHGLPNTDSAVVITNFEHKNEFYDQDSSSDPVCIYIFSVSMHGRDCANILPLSHTKTQPQRKMACIIN